MSQSFKIHRKVSDISKIKGYKPCSTANEKPNLELVNLLYLECEALRLNNCNLHNYLQASLIKYVDRPTVTRIYASALQKITKSLFEDRQISIREGHHSNVNSLYCNIMAKLNRNSPECDGLFSGSRFCHCSTTSINEKTQNQARDWAKLISGGSKDMKGT
jgi:uncharacterized protein